MFSSLRGGSFAFVPDHLQPLSGPTSKVYLLLTAAGRQLVVDFSTDVKARNCLIGSTTVVTCWGQYRSAVGLGPAYRPIHTKNRDRVPRVLIAVIASRPRPDSKRKAVPEARTAREESDKLSDWRSLEILPVAFPERWFEMQTRGG